MSWGHVIFWRRLEKIPYKLFVNTGSSSEYGFKQKPMQEDDLPEPNSYYAVAKLLRPCFANIPPSPRKNRL